MGTYSSNFNRAISQWISLLSPKRVFTDKKDLEYFSKGTEGFSRKILAALFPQSAKEVQSIVKIANKHVIPLYPVGTGHNWGYGSALPTKDNCVLLNLSRMNKILHFDEDLGLVTVEPGVTQQQLFDFVQNNNLPYIVPITGAGPTGGIMGNALERGLSLGPVFDTFLQTTALEVVLSDGTIYCMPHSNLGGKTSVRPNKWSVGPYFDGIFSQGNFGIVTQITISLLHYSSCIGYFEFVIPKNKELPNAVGAIQRLTQNIGNILGPIHLRNALWKVAQSHTFPCPSFDNPTTRNKVNVLSRLEKEAFKYFHAWNGQGILLCDEKLAKPISEILKDNLAPHVKNLSIQLYVSKEKRNRGKDTKNRNNLNVLQKTLGISPGTTNLNIIYWRQGKKPMIGDPVQEGAGILWFAPVSEMKGSKVQTLVNLCKKILIQHFFPPAITLGFFQAKYVVVLVNILLDPKNTQEVERSITCWKSLYNEAKQLGFLPYRVPIEFMELFVKHSKPFWEFTAKVKSALDPQGIIAPGRYSLI